MLVIALAAALVWQITSPPSVTHTSLPNPNGYDDFLRAAQSQVTWATNFRNLSIDELRGMVQQHSQALVQVREGLTKQSAVRITNEVIWQDIHHVHLQSHRSMVLLLSAEGMIAVEEHRTNDAARAFTDATRLAHAAMHRGLMLDDMVTSACQTIAAERLKSVSSSISNNLRREIIQNLVALDTGRETATKVLERDRAWTRGTYGTMKSAWARLVLYNTFRKTETNFIANHNRSVAALRIIIIDLAVRGHMAENSGKPPQKLDDLVPTWLPAVPIDPISNKPFIYQPDNNSFSLSGGAPDAIMARKNTGVR